MVRIIHFVLLTSLLTLVSCVKQYEQTKKVSFTNLQSDTIIHIQKTASLEFVVGLTIKIKGKVNQKTNIDLTLKDGYSAYPYSSQDGNVNFELVRADWYSDDCYVKIKPDSVATGSLTMVYAFY